MIYHSSTSAFITFGGYQIGKGIVNAVNYYQLSSDMTTLKNIASVDSQKPIGRYFHSAIIYKVSM